MLVVVGIISAAVVYCNHSDKYAAAKYVWYRSNGRDHRASNTGSSELVDSPQYIRPALWIDVPLLETQR